ncbi:hypothetical protein [Sphingobacterium sp. UBA5670]|uniref:hypothetical protein n=1 Tax=Sphingobacterium sp. UBA5670 TaxID=1947502 RepID=UPI0025F7117D|nr:hypothetical protein [Sphingobacterium sp. UBA5670]
MMNYYQLSIVSDPEIKGVTTGLGQVELDKDNPITEKLATFFSGIDYWTRNKYIPDFEIEGCTASLYKKAKLTDFLDFSPFLFTCPFMLSERAVKVFLKFNIQKYYTYPVTLFDKGKPLQEKYELFCCPLLQYDIVDFEKSIFYKPKGLYEKTYLNVNDNEEYRKHSGNIRAEELVLNPNFDTSLDFFCGRIGGMYVSEGLKNAIENLGLTGVKIYEDKEPRIVIA